MRSISNQRGVSDTTLLFAFVLLFIVAVIALPKYLKWRETANLPAEVRALRQINAAEQKYRTKISLKGTFGSFKQLVENKVLSEICAGCDENTHQIDGLRFRLNRNYDETRFCVSTNLKNGRPLAMDTDGKIFESETNSVGCGMGEVVGANLKEFKK